MLILSKDKKKIVNLDKITNMYILNNTVKCMLTDGGGTYIGLYNTEERAKEVLQEIFKVYRLNKMFECSDRIEQAQTLQAILKENMQPFTYEMPEK